MKIKKQKPQKRKLKFEDYKNCLESTQFENTNQLEKNKIVVNRLKENRK